MLAHYLLPLSFLCFCLTSVQGSPVRQANRSFIVKIRSKQVGSSHTVASAQGQDDSDIPTFDPAYALREYNSIPFKYARANQFLRGIHLNADTHPEAGYPQFDPNNVSDSQTLDLPKLQAQDAPDMHTLADPNTGTPGVIGGVPPVGPKTTTMPLVDFFSDIMDVLYHGDLEIGTPAQHLSFQADTGSADLWMPCNCQSCANDDFKTRRSSSYQGKSSTCAVTYGIGSVSGVVAQDVVSVGDLTVPEQAFCAVQKVSDDFNEQPISGILGLAYGTISTMKQPTFFENLLKQRKLVDSIFSMHLTRQQPDGSEVCLGCYDSTKATGPLSWHPVISRTYWSLAMDGVSVNNQIMPTNMTAAIDSGSSLSHLPQGIAEDLYAMIPGSEPALDYGDAFYQVPCNATVDIAFLFNGLPYAIDRSDLILGRAASNPDMCITSIVAIAADFGDNFAIVGDNLLKSWYTVFDYAGRVGFAPSINNRG